MIFPPHHHPQEQISGPALSGLSFQATTIALEEHRLPSPGPAPSQPLLMPPSRGSFGHPQPVPLLPLLAVAPLWAHPQAVPPVGQNLLQEASWPCLLHSALSLGFCTQHCHSSHPQERTPLSLPLSEPGEEAGLI